MKVLVCGGRDYGKALGEAKFLNDYLSLLDISVSISAVIQGGAKGADALAKEWASRAGIPCHQEDADWAKHWASAGPIRNEGMLVKHRPAIVVSFPGGSGTADMIKRALRRGVTVLKPLPGAHKWEQDLLSALAKMYTS